MTDINADTLPENILGEGMVWRAIPSDRYKTSKIRITLTMPMEAEHASDRAAAIKLLSRSCEEYPTRTAMKKQLAMLYGASINGSVSRHGDQQQLWLEVTTLSDRFSLERISLSMQCTDLLCRVLMRPALENGLFPAAEVEMEKRLLREQLESQRNDKLMYSLDRCLEETFKGQPAGLDPLGTMETIDAITPESVTAAWRDLLSRARICVIAVGDMDFRAVRGLLSQALSGIERHYSPIAANTSIERRGSVNEVIEPADAVQSKMCLSFSLPEPDDFNYIAQMFSRCLGGDTSSRLFNTVREQLSLCYYCGSTYSRSKNCMLIYSGLETGKLEEAKEEILRQCRWIADGKLTEEEITAARLSYANSCAMAGESAGSLIAWYSSLLPEYDISPEQAARMAAEVTPEQIAALAAQMELDTVYILRGDAQGQEDAQ
ncbi:MAG: insulinase family protein [Ruminococcaceae bacterium]|nr:insulinase family protein [Oscillospiraceae bacterium]